MLAVVLAVLLINRHPLLQRLPLIFLIARLHAILANPSAGAVAVRLHILLHIDDALRHRYLALILEQHLPALVQPVEDGRPDLIVLQLRLQLRVAVLLRHLVRAVDNQKPPEIAVAVVSGRRNLVRAAQHDRHLRHHRHLPAIRRAPIELAAADELLEVPSAEVLVADIVAVVHNLSLHLRHMVVHLLATEELVRRERRYALRHPLPVLVLELEHIDYRLADDTFTVLPLSDHEADIFELMLVAIDQERSAELLQGAPHTLIRDGLTQHLVPERTFRVLVVVEVHDDVRAVLIVVRMNHTRLQVEHAVVERHIPAVRHELAPLLVHQRLLHVLRSPHRRVAVVHDADIALPQHGPYDAADFHFADVLEEPAVEHIDGPELVHLEEAVPLVVVQAAHIPAERLRNNHLRIFADTAVPLPDVLYRGPDGAH